MQEEPVLSNRIIRTILLHDQIMTNQLNLHDKNIFMSYGIPRGITQISSFWLDSGTSVSRALINNNKNEAKIMLYNTSWLYAAFWQNSIVSRPFYFKYQLRKLRSFILGSIFFLYEYDLWLALSIEIEITFINCLFPWFWELIFPS